MARALSDIIAVIRGTRATKPELADLDGPLSASDYAVWEESIGYSQWLFENKVDALKAEIQTIVDSNVFGTDEWWHEKILEFQYDPANPQVIEEIAFVARYAVIDVTLRIITRASVRTINVDNRRQVSVKVAKLSGSALGPLNDAELAAFTDYTLKLRGTGISMEIVSLFPDRLKLVADVYYSGLYGADLVRTNVIAAIEAYCLYISQTKLDGQVKLLNLVDFVQAVPGVSDFVINAAYGRDQATAVGSATLFNRIYPTAAGYIIPEDTAGSTLADTLNMIANV
ncbi:hypothetical protein BDD43_3377 [Mucilaginibacter gracilis]|uniref:Uncharacterized protein n=1 Tax=Mucilaginibacter gracilis TaxID=423350 RepID=A0A495J2H7_9SPHI|nr:hypothetical protein [Mucilaginibacter gracilis]RKR83175.1 hypothetical protein BDD43_3377 [Mucilaginibacter gracilis]